MDFFEYSDWLKRRLELNDDTGISAGVQSFPTIAVNVKTDDYDILVDRTTIFGNPFKIGKDGTRNEVIDMFEEWVYTQPELLKGKRLGCHCKPKKCHADILAKIANSIIDEEFE